MPASDQGLESGRYRVIPRTLIFLTSGESVLLLKGAPDKRLWANLYNGVGGHIERGEDVLTAARRELIEETGLSIPGLRLCGIVTIDSGEATGIAVFVLRAECQKIEIIPSQEGNLEWVPYDEIGDRPLVADLHTLLPHVLAMGPCDPPFAAQLRYNSGEEPEIKFG